MIRPLCMVLVVTAVVAGVGCESLPGPDPADQPIRPTAITDPATLYREHCAGCHGDEGRPGAAVRLADPVYLALADDAWLERVTAQGLSGTAMPAFGMAAGGPLTAEQVTLLVAGMRTLWGNPDVLEGATPPPLVASAGNPHAGAAAYATFCARCHGADGSGGDGGGSIVDGSYLGLVSDQTLHTAVLVGRPALGMPDWRALVPGRAMTASEVADVVAWLAAKRPALAGAPYPIPPPTEAAPNG
jgi:mono/diheme cytochrome c family protein